MLHGRKIAILMASFAIFSANNSTKACPEAKIITGKILINLSEKPQTIIGDKSYMLVDPKTIEERDFGNAKPLQTPKLLKEFTKGKVNEAYTLKSTQVAAKSPYCVYNIGFVKINEIAERGILALQEKSPPPLPPKKKAQG